MKKILILGILLGIMSCSKENNLQLNLIKDQSSSLTKNSDSAKEIVVAKPKLKFKHSGPTKPGEPPKSCEVPLGICFIFGIQEGSEKLTDIEIAEGINTATIYTIDSLHLKIIPDAPFVYQDGTIEIEGDFYIDDKVSEILGYDKILIKKGIYSVDLDEGTYGSVILDIIATPKNNK